MADEKHEPSLNTDDQHDSTQSGTDNANTEAPGTESQADTLPPAPGVGDDASEGGSQPSDKGNRKKAAKAKKTKAGKGKSNLVTYAVIGVGSLVFVGALFVVAGGNRQAPPSTADSSPSVSDLLAEKNESSSANTSDMAASGGGDLAEQSAARLENLRAREAELDELYGGNEPVTVSEARSGADVSMDEDFGQLSNFDSAPAAEPEPSAEPAPAPEPEPVASNSSEAPAEPVEAAPAATIDASQLASLEQRLETIAENTLTERDVRHMLEDATDNAASVPADTQARLNDLAEQLDGLEVAPTEALQARIGTIAEHLTDLTERMEELEDSLEEAPAPTAATSDAKPSPQAAPRPNVSNLYAAVAIENGNAILEGQNTGRIYTLAPGDALAYGGRLSAIEGDEITLKWPHRTVRLSVF